MHSLRSAVFAALLLLVGCAHGPVYNALDAAGGTPSLLDMTSTSFSSDRATAEFAEECDLHRAKKEFGSGACANLAETLRLYKSWKVALELSHEACETGNRDECYFEGIILFEGRQKVPAQKSAGEQRLRALCADTGEPIDGQIAACSRLARASAEGELSTPSPQETYTFASRACSIEILLPVRRSMLGGTYERSTQFQLGERAIGGACRDFADALFRSGEYTAKFTQASKRVVEREQRGAMNLRREDWVRELRRCIQFSARSAQSCAAAICPEYCQTTECVSWCAEDASEIQN